jgi:hypothetical protein
MPYARVTTVKLTEPRMGEVLEKAGRELVPVFWAEPGFVAYYVIRADDHTGLTTSVWETREQAERSAAAAAAWIERNVGPRAASVETYLGEIMYSASRDAAGTAAPHA